MQNKHVGKTLLIFVNKMKRYLDNQSQKIDITLGKSRMLRYIYDHSEAGYIYQKELENAFAIRGSSVAGLMDSLIKQALIDRIDCVDDKRKKKISLTKKGEEIAKQAIKQITVFEQELEAVMTKEEVEVFYKIFNKLDAYIDAKEQEDV